MPFPPGTMEQIYADIANTCLEAGFVVTPEFNRPSSPGSPGVDRKRKQLSQDDCAAGPLRFKSPVDDGRLSDDGGCLGTLRAAT
jgi:hypothetical protein